MPESPEAPVVLIVDDDDIILTAIRETLRDEGYQIHTTISAKEALSKLQQQTFAVIVSDQRMPEMSGLEFLGQARQIQPNASRVLITGVLTLKTIIDAVNQGEIFRFLAKPWIREELLVTIRNGVQRFELLELNSKLQSDTLRLNEQQACANADLQAKVRQLSTQQEQLEEARRATEANFEQSLQLCYRIIDAYHPLLGRETKDMVDLCQRISESDFLSQDDQHILHVACWLQNIGLIGVPRELIIKARQNPTSLNPREEALIRNHPVYGEFLASFVGVLSSVASTIRAHHERWDGTGFPDGLAGEAIPNAARYLAVIVHFVECGLPREMALEEILRQSGKAFDPEAVRIFLKVTREGKLPKRVKEITFQEMREGMIMAKGIHSPAGMLLIPEGHTLDDHSIHRLRQHNRVDPNTERLLVYY